jgi:hypothetical protein
MRRDAYAARRYISRSITFRNVSWISDGYQSLEHIKTRFVSNQISEFWWRIHLGMLLAGRPGTRYRG